MADVRIDAMRFDLEEDAAWEHTVRGIELGVYQGPTMLRGIGFPDIFGLPGRRGKD